MTHLDCHLMTGQRDYLMSIVVRGLRAFERFLRDKLTQLDGIASMGQMKRPAVLLPD